MQYVDTAVVAGGDVPVEATETGRRAVVAGFVLIVDTDGNATVLTPAGRAVTVRPEPYPTTWVTDGMPPLDEPAAES